MIHHSAIDSLFRSSTALLLNDPFFGRLLSSMVKRSGLRAAELSSQPGPGLNFELQVNELQWASLGQEYSLGRLKHQLLHLLLRHPFRYLEKTGDPFFNLAADLEVDQLQPLSQRQFVTLPPCLQASRLRSLKEWQLLLSRHQEVPEVTQLQQQQQAALAEHRSWSAMALLSAAERKILARNTRRWLEKALNSLNLEDQQSFPEGLLHYLQAWQARGGTISWQRLLHQFVGRNRGSQHRLSLHRPSKRYPASPGLKIQNRPQLLVALDTSGSIADIDLQAFFREIHQIWRRGAVLTIVECDNRIRSRYRYSGRPPKLVKGRGQTDFAAPLQLLNKLPGIDGLIYFTDGYGQPPTYSSHCPILWVISRNGISPSHLHWPLLKGQKIRLN